jgi:hypothetical protein
MGIPDLFLSWLEPDRNGIAHGRIDPFDSSELAKLRAEMVSALSIDRDVALTRYSGRAVKSIDRGAKDDDRFVIVIRDSDDRLDGYLEESFAEAIKRVRNAAFHSMEHSVLMLRESFLVLNDWPAENSDYLSRCIVEKAVSGEFERLIDARLGTQLITKLAAFLCAEKGDAPVHVQRRSLFLTFSYDRIDKMLGPNAIASISIKPGDAVAEEAAPAKDVAKSREESNRLRVLAAREALLASVVMYSSEDLAGLRASITTNVSQLGQDLRNAGKVFGVRHGRAWYYPQFQFDGEGVPHPEMTQVLEALGREVQGFDYLQWFLEQNARLDGQTPLEVWSRNRQAVVEAAREAHWLDRD